MADGGALGGVAPDLHEEGRGGDVLRQAAALGHGLEGAVAEAFDAEFEPEVPDADEDLVRGHVAGVGEDMARVEEILGVGKHIDRGTGQPHNVLNSLGGAGFVKEFAVEGRLGTKEVFLDAERLLVGADENDDEQRVGVSVTLLAVIRIFEYRRGAYSHENALLLFGDVLGA